MAATSRSVSVSTLVSPSNSPSNSSLLARKLLARTAQLAMVLSVGLVACSPTTTASSSGPAGATTEASGETAANSVTDGTAATEKVYAKDGIAIGGADPVAYFTEATYVPGSREHTYEWQGVTWQFASAENRDTFSENPAQYAPEYGGHCAWAVAARNSLVPIDPNAWKVVDGKLYLNANKRVQSNWEKDIPGFIAQADENWPNLAVQ